MQLHTCLLAGVAALVLAACGPDPDTAGAGPPAPGAADVETTDVGDPPASGALEPAGARTFSCESGHRVELVGEDMARITLADGRVIELPRKSDGVAEYRGEALTFDLDGTGSSGVLGQDEVGGFDCEPAG